MALLQQATPAYLDQCRAAQRAEQAQSLSSTSQWAHVDKAQAHADFDAFYKALAPLVDTNDPASPASTSTPFAAPPTLARGSRARTIAGFTR